jgi:hypothetical protein
MLGNGIFSIFGAGLNAAMSSGAANEQWGNQLKLMDIQNRYNEQMAKNNQQRNKDLWDYTNYENQKQHIKNAGLNPALMYGMGGGGGVSANGAQGQGVTQPTDRSVEMGLKQQGLGLQLASIASQVELNKSQAEKNKAEADKIAGVDTDVQKATMENIIAQTSNEKIKKGLIYAETRFKDAMEEFTRSSVDEVGWKIKNLMKSLEIADKNIKATELDNELKSRTMEANVKQAEETLKNTMADTLVKFSQGRLNEVQAKAIVEQVKQGWSSIEIKMAEKEQGWQQLEQQAQKIMNDLKLGEKGLDIQQQNVIKDYVLGFGQMATQILTTSMKLPGGGTIIKGFGK